MNLPHFSSPLLQALFWALVASLVVLYVARRALARHGRVVPRQIILGLPIVAALAVIVAFSMITVEVGTVGVVSFLGKVRQESYEPGFHFVMPGSRHQPMHVRRQIFELSGGSIDAPETAVPSPAAPAPSTAPAAPGVAVSSASAAAEAQRTMALSLDGVPLATDVTFPYQLSADLAWKVFALIGPSYEQQLLVPAARAALREAAAGFSWTDAVTTKRVDMEKRLHTVFVGLVKDNLVASGFGADEATKVFTLIPPQIRRMAPPRRILAAVAEVKSAEEDLKRQAVLADIAAREAERRANEGVGVRRLLEQLPKNMTTEQVRQLLYALADKQRADSLQRAVEKDQTKVIVLGGGPNPQITVPAQ